MFVVNLKHNYKGRYTLGEMSLQHFAATNHSVCTGRAISCCNKLRDTLQREIASCVSENQKNFYENLCLPNRILSPQQIAGTRSHLILCDSLGRQNFVAESKFLQKPPVHSKLFATATCCSNLSPMYSDLKAYSNIFRLKLFS